MKSSLAVFIKNNVHAQRVCKFYQIDETHREEKRRISPRIEDKMDLSDTVLLKMDSYPFTMPTKNIQYLEVNLEGLIQRKLKILVGNIKKTQNNQY